MTTLKRSAVCGKCSEEMILFSSNKQSGLGLELNCLGIRSLGRFLLSMKRFWLLPATHCLDLICVYELVGKNSLMREKIPYFNTLHRVRHSGRKQRASAQNWAQKSFSFFWTDFAIVRLWCSLSDWPGRNVVHCKWVVFPHSTGNAAMSHILGRKGPLASASLLLMASFTNEV